MINDVRLVDQDRVDALDALVRGGREKSGVPSPTGRRCARSLARSLTRSPARQRNNSTMGGRKRATPLRADVFDLCVGCDGCYVSIGLVLIVCKLYCRCVPTATFVCVMAQSWSGPRAKKRGTFGFFFRPLAFALSPKDTPTPCLAVLAKTTHTLTRACARFPLVFPRLSLVDVNSSRNNSE
jgi:hypothetical protein